MADIAPSQFAIDSTMEYVSDQFRFEKPGSTTARAASRVDRVTLRHGLLDGSNAQQLITQITNAIIDEYEITIDEGSIVERIRGRDQGASLLEKTYKQLYRRSPITVPISKVLPPPGVPEVVEQIGRFKASQIAKDACKAVGLELSWGCRDYELLTDFSSNGSIISVLRTLVKPWDLVAPFKVDIYIQGTTVMIVPRSYPFTRIDFSSSLKNAKRTQFIIRKRPTRPFGLVVLRGQKLPTNSDNKGGSVNKNFSVSYPPDAPVTGERIAYDVRYRLPDNVLLYEQRSTYANSDAGSEILVSRETTYKDWTTVQYDDQGRPLRPADPISERLTVERVDPSDESQLLRVWNETRSSFGVDSDHFVNNKVTVKQELDLDSDNMVNSEMEVMDIVSTGPLLNDTTTTTYKWGQDINDNFTWLFQQSTVAPSGGHKPGGPGRGQPTSIIVPNKPGPMQGGSTQILLAQQFPIGASPPFVVTDLDFSYSNEHLTMEDLQFIMAQFVAANAIWEYEVEFSGVAQAWLQRGSTIQFTDVFVEPDGVTTFTLPVMLITEVRMIYDESKSVSSALYKCRAFGYAAI